jgi:hypothetical protein
MKTGNGKDEKQNAPTSNLLTPVLLKTGRLEWPKDERLFYLMAREGIFRCRNHEFFRSCVKVESGPAELQSQKNAYEPSFPEIPAGIIERAVGFFSRIAELHGSEAAALLIWDSAEQRVRLVVPDQKATMAGTNPKWRHPIGVHYDPPIDLPDNWVVFGDIHCHVDYAAYASGTDIHDELHSAGLHIVVGRISEEPPEFHVEAVVDGTRFTMEQDDLFSGYERRDLEIPADWIDKVKIEDDKWSFYSVPYSGSYNVS